MTDYYILMGDIIKSGSFPALNIQQNFKKLIATCNKKLEKHILSPYTITLGDEFQGVANSLKWSVNSLFYLEETILKNQLYFKIRYVIHYGEIKTSINKRVAHGMMGTGLARARELLTQNEKRGDRFLFALPDQTISSILNKLFSTLNTIIMDWSEKDFRLISDLLVIENNAEIGQKHGKNRSQIWKRRKNLRIRDYQNLKEAILTISNKGDYL